MFHHRIVPLPNATITELGITELFYYGLLSPNSTITECYYYRTGYYRTVLLRFIITECCTLPPVRLSRAQMQSPPIKQFPSANVI